MNILVKAVAKLYFVIASHGTCAKQRTSQASLNPHTCLFAFLPIKLFSSLRGTILTINSVIHESLNSLSRELAHIVAEAALPKLFPIALLYFCLSDWLPRTFFQSFSKHLLKRRWGFKFYIINNFRFQCEFQTAGILKSILG